MATIDRDTLDAVRDASDLVELIGGRVDLTRKGGRWVGRCPFHDERTPSFSLIPPENRRYICFSCGAKGDVFTWMMEREGIGNFQEAVTALAERYGVALNMETETPQEAAARRAIERRRQVLDRAADYYMGCLWNSPEATPAREYLTERGFTEELLRQFRVGYAPLGETSLANAAKAKGFTGDELRAAGLARGGGFGVSDFFTGRIMFPIADRLGRVLGFGGRVMPGAEGAKYINSPEGAAFKKRELLFGLSLARAEAAKRGWIVVVEGYTDVLALHAAGVPSVACMGTSLTAEQLRELARSTKEVRICFDGDAAGERAAYRSVDAAAGIPLRLSSLRLPDGKDPGDMAGVDGGLELLGTIAEQTEPLILQLVRARVARTGTSANDRQAAFDDLKALLSKFPESMEHDEAVRIAASLLRLPARMTAELSRRPGPTKRRDAPTTTPQILDRDGQLERRILVLAAARIQLDGPETIASLSGRAFEGAEHASAAALLAAGTRPADWPIELAGLAATIESEAAAEATAEELSEAVLRFQENALERQLVRLRETGDDEQVVRVQTLLRRVREALRGG